ncbi:MAG: sigma-54 dependent transcriptional regulator [Candidatus Zixiibacteriota bacterium]
MPDILLIDDEHEIRSTLKAALGRRGYSVDTCINIKAAKQKTFSDFDAVMLDVMLPDGDGVALLEEIVAIDDAPPVIMISGHSGIDTAVKAIQIGAVDFLEKPLSLDRVLITIENVLKTELLRSENISLSRQLYGEMIGKSAEIKKLIKDITTTAPRSNRFLILGENGTGKELAARIIHRHSRYKSGRFVPVNCAALPKELVESELFGHIKGSFTGATSDKTGRFAEADGGTIFLDEIADMSTDAQAKILRILESGELRPVGSADTIKIDLSVIAATNKNILKAVDDGSFRQDLFYRLNVVTFNLPPLRERKKDIVLLFEYFLNIFAQQSGRTPITLSKDAKELLQEYHYPGNVRELKNIAERISIYIDKDSATQADIKPLLLSAGEGIVQPLKDAVESYEADYIKRAISTCGGNIAEAARRLGLERSHLYKKMKKLGMD